MYSNNSHKTPVWLRPKNAIRVRQISMATLYRMIDQGEVQTMKIGGLRYVDCADFVAPFEEVSA
jgi:predicted DNA-binding transcriptional regulator AlpA